MQVTNQLQHKPKKSLPNSPQQFSTASKQMRMNLHMTKRATLVTGSPPDQGQRRHRPHKRLPSRYNVLKQTRSDERVMAHSPSSPEESTEPPSNPFDNRPNSPTAVSKWFYSLKKPLKPAEVLREFAEFLSPYEHTEIKEVPQIHTIGILAAGSKLTQFNDERGFYRGAVGDHLNYRYEIIRELGEGTFGNVFQAFDCKKQIEVAIKVLRDDPRFIELGKFETHVLKYLRRVDLQSNHNIVNLLDSFMFRGHLCMCFELLGKNLYEVLEDDNMRGFPHEFIKRVGTQLLCALKLLYKHGILHCDLKPENVLTFSVNPIRVKLIDFGSSCFQQDKSATYLQSRYYRAPEIVLKIGYGLEIDIWSLGCILFELHTGLPLFPAESSKDLIEKITSVLGPPPDWLLMRVKQPQKAKYMSGMQAATVVSLAQMLAGAEPSLIDFIEKCLKWAPNERLTPLQAFSHPFVRS